LISSGEEEEEEDGGGGPALSYHTIIVLPPPPPSSFSSSPIRNVHPVGAQIHTGQTSQTQLPKSLLPPDDSDKDDNPDKRPIRE